MAAAEGGSEDESHGDVDGFGASAVDGTMCGARLRRRGREGEPPVLEVGAEKMTRWGWVGGKV